MIDYVADAPVVIMPVTALGEIEAGFELGSRVQENRHGLADFLNEPFVSVLNVTSETVSALCPNLRGVASSRHTNPYERCVDRSSDDGVPRVPVDLR